MRRLRRAAAALAVAAGLTGAASSNAAAQAYAAQVITGTTAVGVDSAPQQITVKPTITGTVATYQVLTNGSQGYDFKTANQTTCASVTAGTDCTVSVIFHPTAPGTRTGAVVLQDINNQVLGIRMVTATATGSLAVIRPGLMENIAGNGKFPYVAGDDGGSATSSSLFLPSGVVADAAGNVYIADSNNYRIRRVDAQSGIITTYAGTGSSGNSGDGQNKTSASLILPTGLAMDGAGNLYIADSGNNAIRRVDAFSGIMTTVAGKLTATGYDGDNGLATQATLSNPNGVAFDAKGNLYIADTGNNAIREVDAVTGIITTIAGGHAAGFSGDGGPAINASLDTPWSITFNTAGVLYFADRGNNTIRTIDLQQNINTVAGQPGNRGNGGNGSVATAAQLNGPTAMAVDPAGNLYIADSGNNTIRRVDAATQVISLMAGSVSSTTYTGDGVNSNQATFYGPYALYLDGPGNLYIADLLHNHVRRIDATKAVLSYPVMRVGKLSSPQGETLENDGNADLLLNGLDSMTDQAQLDSSTTNCMTGNTLTTDANCNLGIVFAPTTVSPSGGTTTGHMIYDSSAGNSPTTVTLNGQVLSVNPTTTTLTSSLNPAGEGQSVTFTAAVKSDATTLTGTVNFYDGSTLLGSVNLTNGSATYTTSTLTFGAHNITAKYSGDEQDAAGTSNVLTENIVHVTQITLSSTPNPSTIQDSVTFSAALVTTYNNAPITSGSITFWEGATQLGSANVSNTGIATFTTDQLSVGTHNITAKFAGDSTNYLASTSNIVAQKVNPASTTTTLSVNPSPAVVGTSVSLTATVTSGAAHLIPTGTVTFTYVNTAVSTSTVTLGTSQLDANGQAALSTSTLPPGVNSIIATYNGDDANGSNKKSASSAFPEQVTQLTTVTTLASSANPANAGSPLQLTATVAMGPSQQADGAITGSITFNDGGTALGTVNIDADGKAILTTSTLAAGATAHSLTATYNGNTNYATSTSGPLAQTVQKTATTTALSVTPTSIVAGKTVTMTATVTNPGVKATQTVTFSDGAGFSQTVTLDANAAASITVSTLSVGTHNLTATYNGDSNYNSSTSPISSVVVSIGTTTLTLTGAPTQVQASSTVTFNAALTTNGVLPSPASITLTDNGTQLTTLSLSAQGTATFSTSTLSVGTHNIVATYAGDPNNATANSQTVTVTVNYATTTTALTTDKNPAVIGDTINIQATVRSQAANISGTVSFYDGNTVIGTSPITNGLASITLNTLAAGQHSLKAVYSGDSVHATSTSTAISQQVVQPASVSLQSNNNPAISGTPVNLVAQVVASTTNPNLAAAPSGTVTYKEGNTIVGTAQLNAGGIATLTISTLSVGSHNIVASYSGDTYYQANTSGVLVQTIRDATTSTVLAVSANPASYGSVVTLTAHITGNGGTIAGNVAFMDGTATIGVAQVASNGTAVFTTSTLSPGLHAITAAYAGDGANGASVSQSISLQVLQPSQTTLVVNTNPALTLSTVILTATIHNTAAPVATGTVSFSDGAVSLGTATVNAAGVATLQVGPFSAGTHNITAAYSGDVGDLPSASAALPLVVQLRPTQTALTSTAPTPDGYLSLISAIHWDGPAVPTGVVTFSTPTGVIGTSNVNSVGVATLNIVSSAINGKVTATYSGDASYSGSASPATTIQLAAATNFTISLNPTTMSVATTKYVVAQLTVNSINGFTDTMNVGCLGLPKAATCTFDKNSVALTSNGSFVVKVTVDTGSPLTAGGNSAEVKSIDKPGSAATTATLAGLPAGALLGMLLLGRRRRKVTASLLILLLAVCLMPMFGCGTIDQVSTPPGSYTFAVSAVGQNTGVTLSQNITLTVTQ